MKKIVIFKDHEVDGKKVRSILRAIKPSSLFIGFSKSGSPIDSEIKKLASYLEPAFTGYYTA
jgi:glucose-6-phosphate isomerase